MRERHFPRLCRTCHAPMARQEDTCWRCGAQWATEDTTPATLVLIAGGAGDQDADRWTNEGGSFETAATAPGGP